MAVQYKCAFCGSLQTWSGTGPRVCQFCGATQPDKAQSSSPGTTTTETDSAKPRSRGVRMIVWLLVLLLVAFGVTLLVLRSHRSDPASADIPTVALKSRILAINNPAVRTLTAGADLSAVDLLHSAPANAGNLLDPKLLYVEQPRGMNDLEGKLLYVGEVTNKSPDRTAVAPEVQLAIVRNGHIVETRNVTMADLPPKTHVPISFEWGGEPSEVQHIVYRWKPVLGYPVSASNHPLLEVNVESKKMTPASVTVNFSYTFHYVTAEVQGTVQNKGTTIARDTQLVLTLYDAKNHVTGYKIETLDPIAPGEQIRYDMSADQWGDPVAVVDVEALAATAKPEL